ncbi:MAG: 3-phosphoglycerate dehydrogenase [Bacteroidales bacterium]|nr:3-phosphoglycerate dehydrogenase [Bacteroidales bacterium]
MKALIATQKPFAAVAVEGIKKIFAEAGYEVAVLEKYETEAEFCEAVKDVDAVIVRSDKVTKAVVAAAKNLKIVVRAGAGYDNLDLEALKAAGVIAMNTPGQNANAVAELAIAMMIYISRGCFTPATGCEIMGKTLGIQAYGNVGKRVADKAKALGMKVIAFDPFVPAEAIQADGVAVAKDLDELYSKSDFLSLHIPAIPATIGSIGANLLSKMPKGACLVNTARQEVINEPELANILAERTDLKYITDVAPANIEEIKAIAGTRFFATPKKMGAQTAEANINAGLAAARQIVAFFEEGCTRFALNK